MADFIDDIDRSPTASPNSRVTAFSSISSPSGVEVPWVDRQPSDILRDHFRVTTQPFDCPDDPTTVEQILDQIGSDEMFLFASDYPHWQFEGSDPVPPHLPAGLVEKMSVANPLATFPRLATGD